MLRNVIHYKSKSYVEVIFLLDQVLQSQDWVILNKFNISLH